MSPTNLSETNLPMHESDLPNIKVIGLGGGGCSTINRLASLKIQGVQLIAANTDSQTLNISEADHKLLLGPTLTGGKGAGGNAGIGQRAAEESFREMIALVQDADMVFLTAGLGGGTGSGAIQIAARIARSLDKLTVSIVTLPFSFEASIRQQNAREAAARLQPYTDTMITIPNDQILKIAPQHTSIKIALAMADDILVKGIGGISELICQPGLMNVELSHLINMMRVGGGCFISTGSAQGHDAAVQALKKALIHPLLENVDTQLASAVIIKLSGHPTIEDLNQSIAYLRECTSEKAEIFPAFSEKDGMQDRVQVTLLLTGIGGTSIETPISPVKPEQMVITESRSSQTLIQNADSHLPDDGAMEDLEMPAFLRKGYNLVNHSYPDYG